MPSTCGRAEASAAEGREWWLQLQRQRKELGIRRRRSVLIDNSGDAPPPKTLQQLLDELKQPADVSPELAHDLGLVTALTQQEEQQQQQPAAGAEALAQGPDAAGAAEQGSWEGEGQATPQACPSEAMLPQRRKSSLARASLNLLNRMGRFEHLELQMDCSDAMARLATAGPRTSEAGMEMSPGSARMDRTASDAAHLASVLSNGSELMARAEQASCAWREEKGRRRSSLGRSSLGGLSAIAEGPSPLPGRASPELPLPSSQPGQRSGSLTQQQPPSPRRVQRKSLLSNNCSSASLSSAGGRGGGGGGSMSGPAGRRGSVGGRGGGGWGGASANSPGGAPLSAEGSAGRAAQRYIEEEQEAELTEVLQMGALGDPEIQAYLIKELARSRRKAARRATTGGRAESEGRADDNDGRLDPIVQAWLVTKVPAPKVAGYVPPPSRTACRLIAAQEMQLYYKSEKLRQGTYFKHLGLTQEQAGNREATGRFVVGSEEKSQDAARGKGLKALVRKSVVSGMVSTMMKNTHATNWAKEHVELMATMAANEVAKQRAIRNWHDGFAKVKALSPKAKVALRRKKMVPAGGSEIGGQRLRAEGSVPEQEGSRIGAVDEGAGCVAGVDSEKALAFDAKQGVSSLQLGEAVSRRTTSVVKDIPGRASMAGGPRATSPAPLQQLPSMGAKAESFKRVSVAAVESSSSSSGALGDGDPSTASLADRFGSSSSSSVAGDRGPAAVDSRAASRLSQVSGLGKGPTSLSATPKPSEGAHGSMFRMLSDFVSVAKAALEVHKKAKEGRPRLSKLPPLKLEKLERTWQQAARQQNTERQRQEQRAKEKLLERWQQLQQRRAGGQE